MRKVTIKLMQQLVQDASCAAQQSVNGPRGSALVGSARRLSSL
jgi:hypothetical protein